ncbi:hypothetical protein BH09BAC1_BH09BAC1_06870 [soil metagenome]
MLLGSTVRAIGLHFVLAFSQTLLILKPWKRWQPSFELPGLVKISFNLR